jgi:hypothetical protein
MTLEQEVRFTGGDRAIEGYFAIPEGGGPFPAVIVILDTSSWPQGCAELEQGIRMSNSAPTGI